VTNTLKETRMGKNILQSQAAEDLQISIRSLSRYENGEAEPIISLALRMADYYDKPVDELFTQ